ncbi:serine/threonine/tyrosine protein kinase [Martiniozyma asiatica (nom. inval.)]|nr:serine/threonine/tyrosine protein kinase [Martiniozyma asiatica]
MEDSPIKPPELSIWATSILKGEQLPTITTSTAFSRHSESTKTSKSVRFFKSLNLGQARRLNDDGNFVELDSDRKRHRETGTTPLKLKRINTDLKEERENFNVESLLENEIDNSELSIELGRKNIPSPRKPLSSLNNFWANDKELILDFKKLAKPELPSVKATLKPIPVPIPTSHSNSNSDSNSASALENKLKTEVALQTFNNSSEQSLLQEKQKVIVNSNIYIIHEQIGRGGSSKVYKTTPFDNPKKFLALKLVELSDQDSSSVAEFQGEINLLKKLSNSSRVVRLLDHEMTSSEVKLVMECGEIDLAHVLSNRFKSKEKNDETFIRYHVQEMLHCIKSVHDANIVHSDLKPANFVFVKGTLKLIDFGISNAISAHTMNIYRESQMGTPNYMAPETLIDCSDSSGLWKVGKPADIWSIGCITYQMVYGHPPYSSYNGTKKILAITNPKVQITYPSTGSDNSKVSELLIGFIKKCLSRNPANRSTVDELLKSSFISPVTLSENVLRDIVRWSVVWGGRHGELANALGATNGKYTSRNKQMHYENENVETDTQRDLERKAMSKLDSLVENLIKKVNSK